MSPFYNPDNNNEEPIDLHRSEYYPDPEKSEADEPAEIPVPAPARPKTILEAVKQIAPSRKENQPRTPKKQKASEPQPKAKAPKAPAERRERVLPTIDSRWINFLGVIFLLIAAYMFIAIASSLFSTGEDQVSIVYNSVGQIVSSGEEVANTEGPFGAWLGNLMVNESLGVGSFVIVFWFAVCGLAMVGAMKIRFWSTTLKCLILSIALSVVIGLLTFPTAAVIRLGGHHGYYINRMLIDYASLFGAIALSIALVALVAVIFASEISRFSAKIRALHKARAEKRAQKAAESLQPEPAETPEIPEPAETPIKSPDPDPSDNSDYSNPSDNPEPLPEPPAETLEDPLKIETNEIEEADEISTEAYDPTADLSHFHFPSIDLLRDLQGSRVTVDTAEQEANKQRILDALAQFDIQIQSISATVGPTITLFEVVPAPGQRIQAIKRVEEDLALALKATGIRIIAPIPGKGTIGIEVPNNEPQVVSMRSIIASKKFQECKYELPMALGATISNEVFIADLAKMPHLLVAGATGQGKSVGLNAIITSLLYKKHPAELKFVLVDPKMVEFSLYRSLERHYLAKLPEEEQAVITDPTKVVATLNSLCVLMDRRYELLSQAGCRGLKEYNQKFIERRLNPEKGHEYMPYIVVIVDEFADLIMTAGKEVEAPICRLAQKARAVGIHVIIATQRPSTNVITGLIKANFPGRIAFRVSQMIDSKTILDRTGAHQLVGRGDMFFSTNGSLERVQCAFVDTPEVEAICDHIANEQGYPCAYELPDYSPSDFGENGAPQFGNSNANDRDPLFEESARFLVSAGSTASTSSLQRRYSIGYNRAGKIMDQLEAAGIVGPAIGSKPRQVLVDPMDLDRIFG